MNATARRFARDVTTKTSSNITSTVTPAGAGLSRPALCVLCEGAEPVLFEQVTLAYRSIVRPPWISARQRPLSYPWIKAPWAGLHAIK